MIKRMSPLAGAFMTAVLASGALYAGEKLAGQSPYDKDCTLESALLTAAAVSYYERKRYQIKMGGENPSKGIPPLAAALLKASIAGTVYYGMADAINPHTSSVFHDFFIPALVSGYITHDERKKYQQDRNVLNQYSSLIQPG